MDNIKTFASGFWDNLDLIMIALTTTGMTLLGLVAGVFVVVLMQRRGWLARKNAWHHWLLKLYWLALPCLGGFLGFQYGILSTLEQQVHSEIKRQRPVVEDIALGFTAEYHAYISQQGPRLELEKYRSYSVEQVLVELVDAYLAEVPLAYLQATDTAGPMQRLAQRGWESLRRTVLREYMVRQIVNKVIIPAGTKYTRLDERTLRDLTQLRFDTLMDADGIIAFVNQQVSRFMRQFYLMVLLQALALLVLIAAEVGISSWLGQRRRREEPDDKLQPTAATAG